MSLSIDIDTSELEAYAHKLARHEQIVREISGPAMRQSVDVTLAHIKQRVPVNTGQLRQSITGEVTGTPVSLKGVVTSPLQPHYAPDVEYGRKPGKMPPVGPIELWARRKLGLSGKELESAAFLIARAIGRRGTKGAFMFRDGTAAARTTVNGIWQRAITKLINRLAS